MKDRINIIDILKSWNWETNENIFMIKLPFPPSVNHYWDLIPMGRMARMIISKRGREFRKEVQYIIGQIKCKLGKLAIKILAYPPDKRKRDIDNLLKAPLDALQHAGVYKDDNQIADLQIIRMSEPDIKNNIIVYIREI